MTTFVFSNDAKTTLAGAITNTAISLNVQAGAGVLFPGPTTGQQFVATLISQSNPTIKEIVFVTARTGDVFTIVRGQESTAALNWNAGDLIQHGPTAAQMGAFSQSGGGGGGGGPITPTFTSYLYYGIDSGVANSMIVTTNSGLVSYIDGLMFEITPAATNLTVTPVINVNSIGSKSLVRADGTNVLPGEVQAGKKINFFYDANLGKMVVSNLTSRQVQSGGMNWVVGDTFGGTANALTASLAPAPTSLTNGLQVGGIISTPNTGPATLTLNGFSAVPVQRNDGVALIGGELSGGVILEYYAGKFSIVSQLPLAFLLSTMTNFSAGNFSGAAPSNGFGQNGQYAFDYTGLGAVYGPKTGGVWPPSPVWNGAANNPFLITGVGAMVSGVIGYDPEGGGPQPTTKIGQLNTLPMVTTGFGPTSSVQVSFYGSSYSPDNVTFTSLDARWSSLGSGIPVTGTWKLVQLSVVNDVSPTSRIYEAIIVRTA